MIQLLDLAAMAILLAAGAWMLHRNPMRTWPPSRWVFAGTLVWAFITALTHLSVSLAHEPALPSTQIGYELLLPVLFLFFIVAYLREQYQQHLADSEATYRLILDNAEELVYQVDLQGRIIFANNTALMVSGYRWEEARGKHFVRVVHRSDLEHVVRITKEKVLKGERARYNVRMITRSGDVRHLDATVVPILRAGHVIATQGIARDVTNERRALNQAQFLASVITESEAPILIFDEDGKITVWNRGLEHLTGFKRADAIGSSFDDLFPDVPDLLLETAARGGVFTMEFHVPVDEGYIPTLLTAYRVMMPDKHAAHAVFLQDISRQRKLEEQLLHHQRMEALGKLAGGIAHDFNNILTIISGNSAILKNRPDLPEELKHYVDAIVRTTKRGANLTSQLLTFSRRQPFTAQRIAVDELIEDTVDLIAHAGWEGIRFETSVEPNLQPLWGDSGRLQQVLMNLCVNARDAMPEGGTLTIRCRRHDILDESDIPPGSEGVVGMYCAIEVADTGIGMDEDTVDKIFEPFYTTKSPSKGTGLGLANVHGIIRQHRGWIEVDSKVGKGSVFRIVLPTADTFALTETGRKARLKQEQEEDSDVTDVLLSTSDHLLVNTRSESDEDSDLEPEVTGSAQLRGSETVLFVDDETLIRDVGEAALEMYGYRVLTASSGREAVEILNAHPGGIDLIVLDWSMKDMDGKGVLDVLEDNGLEIPVLMQSGVWPATQKKKLFDHGARGFLSKPYMPDNLVSEIRRILDEHSAEKVSGDNDSSSNDPDA